MDINQGIAHADLTAWQNGWDRFVSP